MIFGKHMNRYYIRFGWLLLAGVLTLLIEDRLIVIIPNMYQLVINGINDGLVVKDGVEYLFTMEFLVEKICLPMSVIIVLMLVGRFLWRMLFFTSAIRMETDLRDRMFARAKTLDCQFYGVNKVGNLMSLFTNDLDTVQECFGWGVVMFVDAVIMGSMAVIEMLKMDKLLTGLAMIPMGLLMAAAAVLGKHMTKKWDQRQEAFSRLSDFSQESFSGIAVIKAFVKEAVELMSFKKLNVENEEANVAHTKAAVLLRILTTLFVESVIGIILGYGGYLVYAGKFNAGQLVEFIGYFNLTIFPIMAISELIDMTSRGKASLDRIGEFLDAEPNVKDSPDAQGMERIRGQIEFRNLTFRYPGAEYDALKNVSFTIEAGQSVGVVGKTGSGKTTVADLLLRTYNVPDGTLFVDGRDINTIKIRDLRAGCAYVPQDNFLFSDTIANNISFGMEDVENVPQAAVLADVDENIRGFVKGYDTILGERGVTVSGGQKQRISIARALMRRAPILILDDAVSAVDTATEKTILENLQNVRAGKTTVLTAHRISTVERMDKILFFDDGALVAAGSHEQLMESCPAYAKMVQLQVLDAEGGEYNG